MMKICVYVVKDDFGTVQDVFADRLQAVKCALDVESVPSFEQFVENWMNDHGAEDLLEVMNQPKPREILASEYEDWISDGIDDGEFDGIEKFEIDVPFSALNISELSPEIIQIITNIFVN